jgi:phosphatidylinositol 3,5-bisphosphate 5-phosphatase
MSDPTRDNTPLEGSGSSSSSSLGSQDQATLIERIDYLHPPNDFKLEVKKSKEKRLDIESDSLSFGADEEDISAYPFSESPTKSRGALPQKDSDGDDGIKSMHRFMLYETSTRFYLVGQDILEEHFRILKIDRTSLPGHLNIFEDENVYDRQSISELLTTIEDGNRGSGGLKVKCSAWGILGFIRFTEAHYMLLITKRTHAAMIGGHYVYQVEATELVPLTMGSTSKFIRDKNPEETRYLSILANIDLTKSFYFSYSYNITQTLQYNISQEKLALNHGVRRAPGDWNDMFVWNYYLLQPAREALKNICDWCVPVIHGYIEQACK